MKGTPVTNPAEAIVARKPKSGRSKVRRNLFIASFILPTLLLYLVFTVYPMLKGIYLSLFDWSGGSMDYNFIGLDNFKEMFKDPIIPKALLNDYFLVAGKVIGFMVLALFFAVALTRLKIKGSGFYRAIFFLPNVISVVVVGVLWRYVYNPNLGFLNSLIGKIKGESFIFPWLGDAATAMWALLPPSIWAGVGFCTLLLIAGILSIPDSLYEAAGLDGATQWQQFWHVTLPLTWEQIQTSVIWIVMTTLNGSFIIVSIMTEGGPDNATQVLGSYLYQQGFRQYHLSYAAAIGVLTLVVSLVTTVALQRIMKREPLEIS
ncbi:carbohydrate ABC transporter permease [Paenibacillus chitinolyticus]|uniref:carbohydrate ABC transporter permease n=1 Tax=Paenibacillus chitinolyticus TaxID=79263 RepID=UPI003D085F14